MKRRMFLKRGLGIGAGFLLLPSSHVGCQNESRDFSDQSRIALARDPELISVERGPDEDRLLKMLDTAMQHYFGTDDPLGSWKKLFKPGDRVGLKVNCLSGRGSTNTILVDAVCERLQQAGIREIIIWDRFSSDLEDAGFTIRYKGSGVRCFGNDVVGFEDQFQSFGQAASLVCNTLTRLCDAVINMPVLKDHGIAGFTMCLKNMFGAIHNPHKFHIGIGDPYIADVNMYPSIRSKVKLHICDAIEAQYEGGPSFMPQWRWNYSGLLISEDPVALDYTGWQIIDEKRKEMGLRSLKLSGREPVYIMRAADMEHRIGYCDPDKISMITC